jgi:hypothetical protein
VLCDDGRPPVPFDVLSIDIGSSPKVIDGVVSVACGASAVGVRVCRWACVVLCIRLILEVTLPSPPPTPITQTHTGSERGFGDARQAYRRLQQALGRRAGASEGLGGREVGVVVPPVWV